jgi:hypothetical protein
MEKTSLTRVMCKSRLRIIVYRAKVDISKELSAFNHICLSVHLSVRLFIPLSVISMFHVSNVYK